MSSAPLATTQSRGNSLSEFFFLSVSEQTDCHVLPSHHCLHINCRALEHLLKALTDQLHEMEKVMLQHMKGMTLLVPEPLHFLLPEPKGLVTVIYPAGVPDSQLEIQRKVRLVQIPHKCRWAKYLFNSITNYIIISRIQTATSLSSCFANKKWSVNVNWMNCLLKE